MYMNEHDRQRLTSWVSNNFHSFGGGQTSDWNPIVNATTNKPPMFAAGVDICEVVDFIVNSIDSENETLEGMI
jgi:hypothetical protein